MGNAAAGPNGRVIVQANSYPHDRYSSIPTSVNAHSTSSGASSYMYPPQPPAPTPNEPDAHVVSPQSMYQYPPQAVHPSIPTTPNTGYSEGESLAEYDSAEWDEKRSMVYMRILSADEFLGRMDETDERIRTLSQVEEREMHLPRVTELMGLRAHLQDELLRIENMLSEDDPNLDYLREFERDHGRVVQVLRDIQAKQKILSTVSIPLEPEIISLALVPPSSSSSISSQAQTSSEHLTKSRATSAHGVASMDIGIQSQGNSTSHAGMQCSTSTDTNLTEDGLKQRHDQEEQKVAKNYAKRLMDGGRLTDEEMNRLLADHLLSMQALRDQQNAEKNRLLANLERKKKERLGAKKETSESSLVGTVASVAEVTAEDDKSVDEADSSDDDDFDLLIGRLSAPTNKVHNDDEFGEFETDNSEKVKGDAFFERQELLSDDLWSKLRSQNSMEEFHEMLDSFRNQEEGRKAIREGEGDRHKSSLLSKLAARKQANNLKGNNNEVSTQELSKEDKKFVDELREKNARLSDGEVEALLKRHLEEVEAMRRQRDAEGVKMYEKLKAKLKSKQAKHGNDYIDVEEEEKELQEVDMDLDDLDRALSVDLIRGRDTLSDDELQKILEKYRKQQAALIKKKLSDRDRLTQKLEEKLIEKKQERKQKELMQSMEDDGKFFRQLQDLQNSGDLTRSSFNEMLQLYLHKRSSDAMKKRQQMKEIDAAEAREKASTLVQENEKAVQLMQNIRNREKSVFDSRLQSRLKAKNTKKS